MRDLSLRHSPLMLFRVCERAVVVVSSAEAAREIYKANDAAFSERPAGPGVDELSRHGHGIILAPYGNHWRLVRRVLVTELLTPRRIASFRRIREEEAARLISSMLPQAAAGLVVNVGERLSEFTAGATVRPIFGDRMPAESAAFMRCVRKAADLASLFDLRDLFPSSRLVGLLLRSSKAERHRRELFRLMDSILETRQERRGARGGDEEVHDMVDVLLRIEKEDGAMGVPLTHGVIRALLIDVFGAALDTTTITLQCVMAELMANPRVMQKAQSDIRRVLGGQDRVHEESLNNLHYLRSIIKETMRLHPPAAFFPRMCLRDCKIQGYNVPGGMIVVTNIWAIARDPKYWDEPEKFIPERFERDGTPDFRGSHFEFIPFGAGRRMCPGTGFACANVEIALASLLYHFDWELPAGVEPADVDMTEVFGLTVGRKAELLLRPIPRVPF